MALGVSAHELAPHRAVPCRRRAPSPVRCEPHDSFQPFPRARLRGGSIDPDMVLCLRRAPQFRSHVAIRPWRSCPSPPFTTCHPGSQRRRSATLARCRSHPRSSTASGRNPAPSPHFGSSRRIYRMVLRRDGGFRSVAPLPDKALRLSASSALESGFGSLRAFNLGARATFCGAVVRS